MIGKEGSYLVTRDREAVEKRRRAELEASHKLSAAAAILGESELSLVKRPIDVPLPAGAGKSACRAAELLVHGNQEFRLEAYVSAIDSYSKGLVAVATAAGEGDLEPMRIALLLNRAACLLHNDSREEDLGQSYSNKALQDCDAVLQHDPRNAAALTRRALAFEAMTLYDEAVEALVAAIAQRTDDKPLAAMLPRLREKAAAEKEEEEDLIDWSKFGLSDPSSGIKAPGDVSPAHLGHRVAADPEAEPEAELSLAAQLMGLSDARPALRVRDYERAAEAMIPKQPEEKDEDDEDAWTARAYGDADFSAQEEEDKMKKSETKEGKNDYKDDVDAEDDDSAPPLDESGAGDFPPGGFRSAPSAKIEVLDGNDDDDGMPALENPNAAKG